jgi:hypothetical protein
MCGLISQKLYLEIVNITPGDIDNKKFKTMPPEVFAA